MFELHEQGLQVNTRTVCKEALHLSTDIKNRTKQAKKEIVPCFLQRVGITQHVLTHVAQKDHKRTEEESRHFIFMSVMCQKVMDMDQYDVFNMDQTSIPFSYHSDSTVEKKRSKTMHKHALTTDTKCFNLAVSVTARVKLLAPMLIFKGKPDRRITTSEFQLYLTEGFHSC